MAGPGQDAADRPVAHATQLLTTIPATLYAALACHIELALLVERHTQTL